MWERQIKNLAKVARLISLLFAFIIVAAGIYTICTYNEEDMIEEGRQLQAKLEENLNKEIEHDNQNDEGDIQDNENNNVDNAADTEPHESENGSLQEAGDAKLYEAGDTEPHESENGSLQEAGDASLTDAEQLGESITAIGDSVMLGAADKILEVLPGCVIDARVSRQVWDALEVAKSLDAKGELGDVVIIGLGTNSPFNESTGQELIDYLGTERTVYWINAYGKYLRWQEESNNTISSIAENNSNVYLLDWASLAAENSNWFGKDGIHLTNSGAAGYAEFLVNGIIELQSCNI